MKDVVHCQQSLVLLLFLALLVFLAFALLVLSFPAAILAANHPPPPTASMP